MILNEFLPPLASPKDIVSLVIIIPISCPHSQCVMSLGGNGWRCNQLLGEYEVNYWGRRNNKHLRQRQEIGDWELYSKLDLQVPHMQTLQ